MPHINCEVIQIELKKYSRVIWFQCSNLVFEKHKFFRSRKDIFNSPIKAIQLVYGSNLHYIAIFNEVVTYCASACKLFDNMKQ